MESREQAFQVMKALADETRFEIYCIVQDSPTPLSVQQIAEELGLHPNTVRPHLERLKESGLVTTEPELSGRVGRPVHLYSPGPRRPAAVMGDRALRTLRGVIAETLGELISAYHTTPQEAYELGRAWGRQIRCSGRDARSNGQRRSEKRRSSAPGDGAGAQSAPGGSHSIGYLTEDLELLGFEPSVERSAGQTVVHFGDCPYRDLAQAAPGIVCTLHEAICDEILDCAGEGIEVVEFHSIESGEPCKARLGRLPAAAGVSTSRSHGAEFHSRNRRRR